MSHSETERSFGPALRAARERRGLTQADVAAQLGVKRETISHWESGKHLPRPKQSARLDAALQTDGTLRALIDQAREAPPVAPVEEGSESVLDVFRRVQRAIEGYLQTDAEGRPLGWCHNLQQGWDPTPLSTAYGLRVLHLIDETSLSRLGDFGRRLVEMQQPDGGWAIRSQGRSRPEGTAGVLNGLVRADPGIDPGPYLDRLESEVHEDDVTAQQPGLMAIVLETLLDLRPDSPVVAELLQALLDSRTLRNGWLLWSQKAEPGLARPRPTVCHTASALDILKRASLIGAIPPDLVGMVDEALGTGVTWLLAQQGLDNTSEPIERRVKGRKEVVYYRHFTAAWVLRSLLICGISPTHPTISLALHAVWEWFDEEHSLWRWGNGDLPVWMTFDGIAALRIAALASLPHP
jgi:transcriptional regulator with XRE-family HTH domain